MLQTIILPAQRLPAAACILAGRWLVGKALAQQREYGTQRAALNLKKQGAPLELALAILRRPT